MGWATCLQQALGRPLRVASSLGVDRRNLCIIKLQILRWADRPILPIGTEEDNINGIPLNKLIRRQQHRVCNVCILVLQVINLSLPRALVHRVTSLSDPPSKFTIPHKHL